jgi:hypothetical protein
VLTSALCHSVIVHGFPINLNLLRTFHRAKRRADEALSDDVNRGSASEVCKSSRSSRPERSSAQSINYAEEGGAFLDKDDSCNSEFDLAEVSDSDDECALENDSDDDDDNGFFEKVVQKEKTDTTNGDAE